MQDQADKAKERMRKTQILRAESVALLEEAKAREQQRRQQREMERETEARRQQLRHQWRVQNPAAPEPAQVTPPAEKDRFRGDHSPRWVARDDASEESGEPEEGKSHGKETDAVSGASVMEAPLLQRGAGEPPETSEWDHDVAHDSCTQAHQLVEEPSLPFAHNDGKGSFVSPWFFGSTERGYQELHSYHYHIDSQENNDPGHVHLTVEGKWGAAKVNGRDFGKWYSTFLTRSCRRGRLPRRD